MLAPRLGDIAETASAVAGAAAQAAETSAEAAPTVKQAARTAPAPLFEAERSRVNGAIEAANRKLKEGRRMKGIQFCLMLAGEPAAIPPLPAEARQPAIPSECLPTCSKGLTVERESWLNMLTPPGLPVLPASAPMTR